MAKLGLKLGPGGEALTDAAFIRETKNDGTTSLVMYVQLPVSDNVIVQAEALLRNLHKFRDFPSFQTDLSET